LGLSILVSYAKDKAMERIIIHIFWRQKTHYTPNIYKNFMLLKEKYQNYSGFLSVPIGRLILKSNARVQINMCSESINLRSSRTIPRSAVFLLSFPRCNLVLQNTRFIAL
jgi:hypothetical protein